MSQQLAQELARAARCARCGTELAPDLLACPSCRRLVHADELARLSGLAREAKERGEAMAAVRHWREMLSLLPADSGQYSSVMLEVDRLSRDIETSGGGDAESGGAAGVAHGWRMAGVGATGLAILLWKFKFVVVFLLTKGKLLLLGLSKSTTLLSMLVSLGAYWAAFGWVFALGLVLSIYVHEMGHVAALRRFGIPASAPMFIPGVGAMVRMKQYPASPREDARVGLAGPIWGMGGVIGTYALYFATGWPAVAAIARVAAWINLFNLLPIWQLDGSRGFRALSRGQRWGAVAALAATWLISGDGLVVVLLVVAGIKAFGDAPEEGDATAFGQFAALSLGLGVLMVLPDWLDLGLPK